MTDIFKGRAIMMFLVFACSWRFWGFWRGLMVYACGMLVLSLIEQWIGRGK